MGVSVGEHRHVFERARVLDSQGKPYPSGRRCACGMAVVGDGLGALNADLVRSSENLNRAMTEAMVKLNRHMEANLRRMFP